MGSVDARSKNSPGTQKQASGIDSAGNTLAARNSGSNPLDSLLPGRWQVRSPKRHKLKCDPILDFQVGSSGEWYMDSMVDALAYHCGEVTAAKIQMTIDANGNLRPWNGGTVVCIASPSSDGYCTHLVFDSVSGELQLMSKNRLMGRAIRKHK